MKEYLESIMDLLSDTFVGYDVSKMFFTNNNFIHFLMYSYTNINAQFCSAFRHFYHQFLVWKNTITMNTSIFQYTETTLAQLQELVAKCLWEVLKMVLKYDILVWKKLRISTFSSPVIKTMSFQLVFMPL